MLSFNDAISLVEYGNHLHVSVWMVGRAAQGVFRHLPPERNMHATAVCDDFKTGQNRFRACLRCHALAVQKAVREKKGYFGTCINGVAEYCYPVTVGEQVIAVIFLGNMKSEKLSVCAENLLDTMAPAETEERLASLAAILGEAFLADLANRSEESGGSQTAETMKIYADRYFATDLTLSVLSNQLHYNAKYLGRVFLREYGMPFSEYLCERRLGVAAERLKTERGTVTEIASAAGFGSVPYFNRVFKKKYGMSPGAWRQKKKP